MELIDSATWPLSFRGLTVLAPGADLTDARFYMGVGEQGLTFAWQASTD